MLTPPIRSHSNQTMLLNDQRSYHTSMASHVPKKNLTRKNGLGEGQKY